MAKSNKPGVRPSTSRQEAQKLGHRGEYFAAWALRLKGYRILETRFRTKQGEVDLIARRGNLVAMVEVKARRSIEDAINAVNYPSQRRIAAAGDIWLSNQSDFAQLSIRYDIVAIVPGKWPHHIEDAW